MLQQSLDQKENTIHERDPQTAPSEPNYHQTATPAIPGKQLWTGRILSGLASAFLLLDGGMKLVKPLPVVQTMLQLGYRESSILGIGIVLIVCTVLYLIARSAILGAVLLTGYLGGAVATNVRVGAPLFNILFPILVGGLVWGGLYLRVRRLRSIHS